MQTRIEKLAFECILEFCAWRDLTKEERLYFTFQKLNNLTPFNCEGYTKKVLFENNRFRKNFTNALVLRRVLIGVCALYHDNINSTIDRERDGYTELPLQIINIVKKSKENVSDETLKQAINTHLGLSAKNLISTSNEPQSVSTKPPDILHEELNWLERVIDDLKERECDGNWEFPD